MRKRALLALGLSVLLLRPASAATNGSLRGRVVDPAGAPLAGAILSVVSRSAAVSTGAGPTDASGQFQVPSLPPADDYIVRATLEGCAPIEVSELQVTTGRVTTLTITLPPAASVQETVKVRGSATVLDPAPRGLASGYTAEFLDNLPILGRNYQEVLDLAPGVTDVDGDGNPNIHGARDTDVGTYLDGVNTTDPLTGKVGAQLNIESIQEIEVKTAGATAEFGRAQGGFANIVTKSGGNDFEGALKFYWRGSALDGDGAGIDDPSLHGGVGEIGLRDLEFDDYLPFLSFSGPIVRDKAWFFVTMEWIHKEDPVNAVTQAFVTGLNEKRAFAKATWQATPTNRVALTVNYDPQQFLNQGLNSLTRVETGYTIEAGGPLLMLKDTAVLSPAVALETTVSYLEGRPGLEPNLGPDTNRDGTLAVDRNGNGFLEAKERDPGEDYDGDGHFDLWEDIVVRDGKLTLQRWLFCDIDGSLHQSPPAECQSHVAGDVDEDLFWSGYPRYSAGDGDRRLTPIGGCEGVNREDADCDGHLDRIDEDRNQNGQLDFGEDTDGDNRLDAGTEDRNGNLRLDDTPFPESLYPYGRVDPLAPDREYRIDLRTGILDGPYYREYTDERTRGTLRQDLSIFVPDFHGAHDVKGGYIVERESYAREAQAQAITAINDPGYRTGTRIDRIQHPELQFDCDPYREVCKDPGLGRITAILPTTATADQAADGTSAGVYLQDTWKPHANLSLSLGVRFDRESMTSRGWSYFTPDLEGDRAARLTALAGYELGKDDLTQGNNDGVTSLGIVADPLFASGAGGASLLADVSNGLLRGAIGSLTRNRSTLGDPVEQLASLYPGILNDDGSLDPALAAALGLKIQSPETFRITNNNLSPRLGLSWDPAGDGRTKIFGAWGRYYDRLFLSTVIGEQGIETVQRYYVFDRDAVDTPLSDNNPNFNRFEVGRPNHNYGTLLSSAPPNVSQVARDMSTPYCDEWLLGFDREIAPETSLSIRAVQRRYRDQLQDVDINHETRVDRSTGRLADVVGSVMTLTNPRGVVVASIRGPDGRPDLFVRNPFFNQVLRVENSNSADYKAFEVELRRRLARRWQMQGSYTYSRAVGSAETFQSRLGNDPSSVESEFGYLDFDQRHVVKANAAFFLPGDWQLGAAAQWASGLPYSIVSRFFALDNAGYQQFRTRYGYSYLDGDSLAFQGVTRNSERNGSTFTVDLSGRKNFVWKRTVWGVSLEVFNVLNQDELRIYSYEPSRTTGFDGSTATLISGPSQIDAERPFGRRFQVGFQVQF